MIINDKKGEYLDTSKIPEIELLVNNIEIDDSDSSVLLFTEKNLDYEKCKKLIKKYDNNMENNTTKRRNTPNIPVNIIDKDCTNIINKNAYIEIMVKNLLNSIRTQKRLDIFMQFTKRGIRALFQVQVGGKLRVGYLRQEKEIAVYQVCQE